jgi:ABC-2 type transport system permease protein
MRGFAALARKEFLEQRRTWKFVGTTGVLTAVALMAVLIPSIISLAKGDERTAEYARDLLQAYGATVVTLGGLIAIIVSMGLLANERRSGTAGMTLTKPVTRASFVATKHVGLVLMLVASVFLASLVAYLLALIFLGDVGFLRYLITMMTLGIWLALTGSISLFCSGLFGRQMAAAGVALLLFIALISMSLIPHVQPYWPSNLVSWGESFFVSDGAASGARDWWPTLPISLAAIAALGVGAWAVFQRKEL